MKENTKTALTGTALMVAVLALFILAETRFPLLSKVMDGLTFALIGYLSLVFAASALSGLRSSLNKAQALATAGALPATLRRRKLQLIALALAPAAVTLLLGIRFFFFYLGESSGDMYVLPLLFLGLVMGTTAISDRRSKEVLQRLARETRENEDGTAHIGRQPSGAPPDRTLLMKDLRSRTLGLEIALVFGILTLCEPHTLLPVNEGFFYAPLLIVSALLIASCFLARQRTEIIRTDRLIIRHRLLFGHAGRREITPFEALSHVQAGTGKATRCSRAEAEEAEAEVLPLPPPSRGRRPPPLYIHLHDGESYPIAQPQSPQEASALRAELSRLLAVEATAPPPRRPDDSDAPSVDGDAMT